MLGFVVTIAFAMIFIFVTVSLKVEGFYFDQTLTLCLNSGFRVQGVGLWTLISSQFCLIIFI